MSSEPMKMKSDIRSSVFNIYIYTHTHTHTHTYIYIYIIHLMTGPEGNSEFCFLRISIFPETKSRETKFTVAQGTRH